MFNFKELRRGQVPIETVELMVARQSMFGTQSSTLEKPPWGELGFMNSGRATASCSHIRRRLELDWEFNLGEGGGYREPQATTY